MGQVPIVIGSGRIFAFGNFFEALVCELLTQFLDL